MTDLERARWRVIQAYTKEFLDSSMFGVSAGNYNAFVKLVDRLIEEATRSRVTA